MFGKYETYMCHADVKHLDEKDNTQIQQQISIDVTQSNVLFRYPNE